GESQAGSHLPIVPLTRRLRCAPSPTSPRKRGEVKQAASLHAHLRDLAARSARVMHESSAPKHQMAQGMPGARCVRSLACKLRRHTSIVTTVTPKTPGIPRAMVLTVSFVLFPVTGLCCHRHRRKYFRQLDASVGASEPHDFAVRLTCCSSKAPSASIASRAQRP